MPACSRGFTRTGTRALGSTAAPRPDALRRIRGRIELEAPVLSRFECDYAVRQQDANELARQARDLDLAYVDPPYNQHPYGSNYFMLNLLLHYRRAGEHQPGVGHTGGLAAFRLQCAGQNRCRCYRIC